MSNTDGIIEASRIVWNGNEIATGFSALVIMGMFLILLFSFGYLCGALNARGDKE